MKQQRVRFVQQLAAMVMIMMLFLITACGANTNDGDNAAGSASAQPTAAASPTASPAGVKAEEGVTQYPLTVTDDTGFTLTFEKAPETVVSLAPSETESLFAIGAGEQVVGVDEYSDYPEEAASRAKVGDMTINIEAVMALNPDLVVASSSMNYAAVEELRKLKVNVLATDPLTYDAVVAKIELLGTIMNRQAEAAEVAGHMRAVKEKVAENVKNAAAPKVYLEFAEGWTIGSDTFMDELITLSGGINIAGSQAGWFEINEEQVISDNPALMIFPDWGVEPHPIVTAIQSRPGWEVIDAVKNGSIYVVAEDPLVRVGPRLAEGLMVLAEIIHPAAFK